MRRAGHAHPLAYLFDGFWDFRARRARVFLRLRAAALVQRAALALPATEHGGQFALS